jgi:hypothetical protein
VLGVRTVSPAHYQGWDIHTEGLNELRYTEGLNELRHVSAPAPLTYWPWLLSAPGP